MFLGKVIGRHWGAKQAKGLEGLKLLRVRPVSLRPSAGAPAEETRLDEKTLALSSRELIAADTLGAGPGEYVLVATGSRVRDVVFGTKAPIKALVLAIIDGADIDVGAVR